VLLEQFFEELRKTATHCNRLQQTATDCNTLTLQHTATYIVLTFEHFFVAKERRGRLAVCCSVLQFVAVCCCVSVLQCDAVCCSVLRSVAVCCSEKLYLARMRDWGERLCLTLGELAGGVRALHARSCCSPVCVCVCVCVCVREREREK